MRRASTPQAAFLGFSLLASAASCSWHQIERRTQLAEVARLPAVIALTPADEETSLGDLHQIARRWQTSRAFSGVVFPFRAGDQVDVRADVRLRETLDPHRTGNFFRGMAVGLTFFALSPVVGFRLTQIHDVQLRSYRSGRLIGEHRFEMRTDVRYGFGADVAVAARDVDGEQMTRIASRVLELVRRDWHRSSGS